MPSIFLSYARADGQDAAKRLRSELEQAGFQIWRDIEDMQGGQAWKDQLRQALRTVDVVIVLLTPAAVASKYVEWEWENALTLEKRVIPLLRLPCEVPEELQRLHYHNLSTDQNYVFGFASLVRDLNLIGAGGGGHPQTMPVDSGHSGDQQASKYNIKIDKAENTRIGDNYNS